jgi:hypothetical protein
MFLGDAPRSDLNLSAKEALRPATVTGYAVRKAVGEVRVAAWASVRECHPTRRRVTISAAVHPLIRLTAFVLATAVVAATLAGSALAALFFVFSPTAATPGDRVSLRTPGTPPSFNVRKRGVKPLQRPIRLYLVSNAIADDVSSPTDPRLHYVGSIVLDRRGRGVLRFIVPEIPADSYAVAGVCVQCARHSAGRTFFVLYVTERDIAPHWRPLMLLRVAAR